MDVICFSDITWNFLWQRQQHLITRFPHDWNIVFVEPSFWLSVAWKVIRRDGRKDGSDNANSSSTPHKKDSNISVTSIITIPGGDRFGPTRWINDRLIRWGARRLARNNTINGDPILLFYKPRYSCVIDGFADPLVCYDITDDTAALNASPDWLRARIHRLEEIADLVTTSSETILAKILQNQETDGHKQQSQRAFYIGNGVDVGHFGAERDNGDVDDGDGDAMDNATRSSVNNSVAQLDTTKNNGDDDDDTTCRHPSHDGTVIGYTGVIGEWFDFKLLERMLTEFPDVQIMLVGWTFRDQKKILSNLKSRYKNLNVMGPRQYDDLPHIVAGFDVCIIPFRIYRLTESVNPVKVYEYFAARRPVVTTALPELRKYADALYFSKNHDQFIDNLKAALSGPYNPERPLQIAKDNDWDSKAADITRMITHLYDARNRHRSRKDVR